MTTVLTFEVSAADKCNAFRACLHMGKGAAEGGLFARAR
jgi:hypothetical protein